MPKIPKPVAPSVSTALQEAAAALPSSLSATQSAYIHQFWAQLPPRDAARTTSKKLVSMATHGWGSLQAHLKKPKLTVRIHNPSHTLHTVVEVLMPDQPFIVDTIWMHLQAAHIAIKMSVHPIWSVDADKTGRIRSVTLAGDKPAKTHHTVAQMYLEIDHISEVKTRKALEKSLAENMGKAQHVVADFPAIVGKLKQLLSQTEHQKPHKGMAGEYEESLAFIRWVLHNNFVFLGCRQYSVTHGAGAKNSKTNTTAQAVKNSGMGILKNVPSSLDTATKWNDLDANLRAYFSEKHFLTVTKATQKAPVHRAAEMDYISFRTYDKNGNVEAEHRFIGLLTSKAYTTAAQDIPIIGRKIRTILAQSGYPRGSHSYKALQNILAMFPLDELLAMELADLNRISLGILHLQDRPQVRLFLRHNKFERQISILIFLPLERMNSALRGKITDILMAQLKGESIDFSLRMGEGTLAQLVFTVRTQKNATLTVTEEALESDITAITLGWVDALRHLLVQVHAAEKGLQLFKRYEKNFTLSYQEHTPVNLAARDIDIMETLADQPKGTVKFTYRQKTAELFPRLRIFAAGHMLSLSSMMPLLENMGVTVCSEHPYQLTDKNNRQIWLHDFTLMPQNGLDCVSAENLTTALTCAWNGTLENDALAALVITASLTPFELNLLRAMVAYHRQAAVKVSKADIYEALLATPQIAQAVVSYVDATFNPAHSQKARETLQIAAEDTFITALDTVKTLSEERLLTKLWGIAKAMLRINAWAKEEDAPQNSPLAFKLDSAQVPMLPKPSPWREIFVYGTDIEGVHLRGGPVARGGLRWSDRHADFRTEVLGLMKAQMTKNTLIVPVGSKGGFVIKDALPTERSELTPHVEKRYSQFINALLSVTDNRVGDKVTHPKNVVCLDGNDPYFVVAADKGTATFSDIANGIAINKGFWLGDAFASGGSVGYDHKGMAITARGAWESVKHHFAGMDVDCQKEDFTVVGIGDMGGDVFGNGMLLSKHIRLVGAFNHLHIFVDPNPDAKTSYKERQRLFKAGPKGGGWDAYDTKTLSKGAKIYERSAKSLTLTPEIQKRFGITEKTVTPDALIRAMLGAQVDLLWNGGIGTYIKAENESHEDVADRANDNVRLNGKEINAKVIGEGGNLGMTQLGRIEAALNGARLNTDALDNAAGVNTSDHEVNIKILLETLPKHKQLTAKKRASFLASMTDNVADLVLQANAAQAQAITLKADDKAKNVESCWRLQQSLVKQGLLDRKVEFLPNEDTLEERQRTHNGQKANGYTRPELCVLMAYAKMDIYAALLASNLPQEPSLQPLLDEYFPQHLQPYSKYMPQHPLAGHIIATKVTNQLVNQMGMTFLNRLREETGHTTVDVVRAWLLASRLFDAKGWWALVQQQNAPAATRAHMLDTIKKVLEFGTFWTLRHVSQPLSLSAQEAELSPLYETILNTLALQQPKVDTKWKALTKPAATAMMTLQNSVIVPDVAHLAAKTPKLKPTDVLAVYQQLGSVLQLPALYACMQGLATHTTWQSMALRTLVHDVHDHHARLTKHIVKSGTTVEKWQQKCANRLALYQQQMQDILEAETPKLEMLATLSGQLKGL